MPRCICSNFCEFSRKNCFLAPNELQSLTSNCTLHWFLWCCSYIFYWLQLIYINIVFIACKFYCSLLKFRHIPLYTNGYGCVCAHKKRLAAVYHSMKCWVICFITQWAVMIAFISMGCCRQAPVVKAHGRGRVWLQPRQLCMLAMVMVWHAIGIANGHLLTL